MSHQERTIFSRDIGRSVGCDYKILYETKLFLSTLKTSEHNLMVGDKLSSVISDSAHRID